MHSTDAYAALAKELDAFRQLQWKELVALADAKELASERSAEISGEPINLEIVVAWLDKEHAAIRITGHARGSSTWHHEHLQENVIVHCP